MGIRRLSHEFPEFPKTHTVQSSPKLTQSKIIGLPLREGIIHMLLAFLLGLTGSLAHCVGMCSAVTLLLKRHPAMQPGRAVWVFAHGGRLTTYAALGALAALFGQAAATLLMRTEIMQGVLALLLALAAFFFVMALMGWAPSPELAFPGLTRRWSSAMRGSLARTRLTPYALGLLWGLLPCGLVFAALFNAAVGAAPLIGAARMLAFGAGTLPALLAVQWLTRRGLQAHWPRALAASTMALFGMQFAFRGLAALGVVEHLVFGGVMLW